MTEHEEKAKALLPCSCSKLEDATVHIITCAARYRPAVAAALDEQYQTGWNEGSQAGHDARYPAMEAELAQLLAKLAERDAEFNAAIESGCQAMGDLNDLSVGITEIFYPNFKQDGMAPACSLVELVKSEFAKFEDIQAEYEAELAQLRAQVSGLHQSLDAHDGMIKELRDKLAEAEKARQSFALALTEIASVSDWTVPELDDLPEHIKRLKAERDEYGTAINDTLRLADDLNQAAMQGAGFDEHWGERVMQTVQALRNTKKFKDETLEHNRSLLEHNGKLIEDRDHWQSHYDAAMENWRNALRERDAAEAKGIKRGLERAREIMRWCPGLDELDCIKAVNVIQAEIEKVNNK